jgi:paraquat-inducible protein B
MANTPRDFDVPEAAVAPKRRGSFSIVWLIPIVAVVIGGWLAVKAIQERGPTITISFKTAEGLEAGKTKIKYKNVDVGEVKHIVLNPDRSGVVATVELGKEATPYLVEDTRFYVVSAHIAAGGVSGLGTLFSGSYIGVDIGKSSKSRREFTGLEVAPVIAADLPGRQFVLRSDNPGSLERGSPVFFRRVRVGQVVASDLDQDGKGVTIKVYVETPYDQYVTTDTRFWQASGVDVTLDATGVRVDTQSLASILLGGIDFQAPPDAPVSPAADADTVFPLFLDRTQAMKRPDTEAHTFLAYFKETLRGLSPGAPVDFHGIVIGEVKAIGVEFDPEQKIFQFPVEFTVYPERLRSRYRARATRVPTKEQGRVNMDRLMEHGLRAQLRSGNLLTGQLLIAMELFPDAPKATIDWTKDPPVLPTIPGTLAELQVMLAQMSKKFENLPLGAIAADLRQTLQTLNRTLDSADKLVKRLDAEVAPVARGALEDARRTLTTAEHTLAADAPLQQDMREALRELTRAAQTMRVLGDFLERHPEALIHGKKEDQK